MKVKCFTWKKNWTGPTNVAKVVYSSADDAYKFLLKMRTFDGYLWNKDAIIGVHEGCFCNTHGTLHFFIGHAEENRSNGWLSAVSEELRADIDKARHAA